jgi:hypothetical protein
MPTEFKTLADGTVVQKYNIIGTYGWTYEAGVPVQSFADSGYTSFTSDESGNRIAILGSECLSDDLNALPAYSHERSVAVRAWQDEKYANAYGKIVEAFPEAAVGRREYGRLSVWILPDGEIRKYGF